MEIFVVITGCFGSFDIIRYVVITCKPTVAHKVSALTRRQRAEDVVTDAVEHEVQHFEDRRPPVKRRTYTIE